MLASRTLQFVTNVTALVWVSIYRRIIILNMLTLTLILTLNYTLTLILTLILLHHA